ncbi:YheT family hydrolase [Calothrix sp. UHCC 0171]|uniref:YheT family hydrolase n=1 Tax=Calothrix sp. UHCC 0171 TaxID=3110245 RepID=UPI002B1EAF84|nr:alpha/beta fold hydrolase [Calothrix sp. UHCC 0171]MEA5571143.1 alpha/beta fold hydrolase [Calothrix sp. UHCC 0171]
MRFPAYIPPGWLQNGFAMTLHAGFQTSHNWENTVFALEPPYQQQIFTGARNTPLFGLLAIPENARGTVVATYGIAGNLEDQWLLRIWGRKAYASGYAVVLFDWRAHGKSLELSPALTSDGLYEGEDFLRIASQAQSWGCPRKFWFVGLSLGGQMALWAGKTTAGILETQDIGGIAAICPSLDAKRSLSYLLGHPQGRYIEKGIARSLKKLAGQIHDAHPGAIDPAAIDRIDSIWAFDHELVIGNLGFPTVEAYYDATSPLYFLPSLEIPTLIIYAENDPFFDPAIAPDLEAACAKNPQINLLLTKYGGHAVYANSHKGQKQANDPDIWWAWNRVLQWMEGDQVF